MAITTDRDVGIMAHLTFETKEAFRLECERRKVSMSFQVSQIIEKWLETAPSEDVEQTRSNKRTQVLVTKHPKTGGAVILRAIPGHQHSIGADGYPSCGCEFEWVNPPQDVPLPLEEPK